MAFYFAMTLFINSNFIGNQYLGCLRMTLSTGHFWFTLFLTLAILLVPVIAIRFYNVNINPTLSDRCRLKQRLSRLRTKPSEPQMRRRSSVRRSRRSIRSGYAFAHQEGFGRLITSGKLAQKQSLRSNASTVANSMSTCEPNTVVTNAHRPSKAGGILKGTSSRVRPVNPPSPSVVDC